MDLEFIVTVIVRDSPGIGGYLLCQLYHAIPIQVLTSELRNAKYVVCPFVCRDLHNGFTYTKAGISKQSIMVSLVRCKAEEE